MNGLLSSLVALLLLAAPLLCAQDVSSGELNIHTSEILDSTMYHPNYTSNATVTKSSNPAIPKGAIARLILFRDPATQIYSVRVIGIVIDGNLVAAGSTAATLPGGFMTRTGHAVEMRGDGHTPSLSGGRVFLPADTTIHVTLTPAAPPS